MSPHAELALRRFLEEGGKITILPPAPTQPRATAIPRTGSAELFSAGTLHVTPMPVGRPGNAVFKRGK